jgi:hypothetical protein
MDPAMLGVAAVAVANFFASAVGQKLAGQAAEKVGAGAGDAVVGAGRKVVALLRQHLTGPDERSTLDAVEREPESAPAQVALQQAIERRATQDPSFATQLESAYRTVEQVWQQQTINNYNSPVQAQGQFNAPVVFNTTPPGGASSR